MGDVLPYILILISDFLFASQFLISRIYSRRNTRGLIASLSYSIGTNFAAVIYMLFVNGFKIEFEGFTILVAVVYSSFGVLLSYCGNAALHLVNLSLYSLFNMLGAVVLSALFGFLIFSEKITLGVGICIFLVILALAVGAEYKGGKKGAAKFYIACFFLNGITGTIVKIHQDPYSFVGGLARISNKVLGTNISPSPADFEGLGTSNNNFFFFASLISLVLAAVILVAIGLAKKENTFCRFTDPKNLACMGGYGVVHGVAQLISFYTLSILPLSLQQPLTTGGVIAFTFVICLIIKEKQRKKDIIAFALACLSMLAILIDYI